MQSAQLLDAMLTRIANLERRMGGAMRTGVISEVDPASGRARVRLLDSDQEFVTAWLPWAESAAGVNKTHIPPSVGQQVEVRSESGDLFDGVIQASVNSDANGRPSGQGDSFVLTSVGDANVTVSEGGAKMVFAVGGSTITLTAAGIVLSAARIDLN